MNISLSLFPVDVSSPEEFPALVHLLSAHTPYSLTVLGSVLNSVNSHPRSSTISAVDPSKVLAWTSQPLTSISPSDLYSVLVFNPISHQFRYFCSAESSPSSPTEGEETHVLNVIRSVLQLSLVEAPKYYSDLQPSKTTTMAAPTERNEDEPGMALIGAVHEKWASCLRPLSASQNPCMRYILPPILANEESSDSSSDWLISQLQESDIETVRGTSHIPRSKEYLLSRSPCSVCIRDQPSEGNSSGTPVAWVLMHADGSIGTLYVDSKFRRRGLAQLAMRELVKKLDFRKGGFLISENDDLGGGALGWNWTDTDVYNGQGRGFFDSFDGWQYGWTGHWTYLNALSHETT
ncbi:hypothetical protein SERLA73DRAFT_179971 [Serpula lacrymans var. lacrymans S7.3]|uniref:GCN5-related N-acetyltransferase Rv2170-like domain-containing protein n=2 Tax=Serpula lacrymans var. lacrymans TaxID=341189 RepID=F8PV79_SERL3|nr:uncharacterized protein SERLADRAFT_465353 [Serpula lacrymans var. lacrymans S7.9]EGN99771.1 hypothetical protein SERLA73DRAFT_179971 [Serpula lacrymans var. lacrymans S7.3]EGO25346.1 hypothetical protein SERLADRAFT_465353 [Serpula lacrymans var. lacrymans S7.9]